MQGIWAAETSSLQTAPSSGESELNPATAPQRRLVVRWESQAPMRWRNATAVAAIAAIQRTKVEVGVLVVERWILARLRNQRFFSLTALNEAIAALLTDLNTRPMRKLGVSRRQLFEELDRPALGPLPTELMCMRNGASAVCRSTITSILIASTCLLLIRALRKAT